MPTTASRVTRRSGDRVHGSGMPSTARIFRTTPIGHDAVVIALEAALRRSGWTVESGGGLYERQRAQHFGEVAMVGPAGRALQPFVDALGLELVGARPLAADEDWEPVSWNGG
jgi:hypothetical protein